MVFRAVAAGAAIERVNPPMTVRRAGEADAPVLGRLGVALAADRTVFVAERGKDLTGAIVVGARPFESEMLERKVCNIDSITMIHGGNSQLASLLSAACEMLAAEGWRLVTCRRPETESATIAALKTVGFHVLERLVTLSRPLAERVDIPADVTAAIRDDAEGCAAIAGEIFAYDRFHTDPDIPDSAADRLKAQWARNSVCGRADAVFVTRENGKITGFNACMRVGDAAVIDLIGVSLEHRGRGLGRALTLAAIAHYTGKASEIRVGTQSSNTSSLALYQATGFRPSSSALTLHAHLS